MNKKNGTLISFVGSRGSGKTTVANYVYSELNNHAYTCVRQHPGLTRRPLLRGIITAISLWRFFNYKVMRYLGFYGRSFRLLPSLYRVYLPLAFMHDLRLVSNGEADILIYDSNIWRGIVSSLKDGELSEEKVIDFFQKNILSRIERVVLVVVSTDAPEAVRRWEERDNITLSPEQRAKEVTQRHVVQDSNESLVKTLASLDAVTVIRLDGLLLPAENAARVVSKVLTPE